MKNTYYFIYRQTVMNKALIAVGIAVAIVIAIAGAYVSLTEPAPEGAMDLTTPQPTEPTTQQTDEPPAEPTEPRKITIEIEETLGLGEGP